MKVFVLMSLLYKVI